MLRLNGLDLKDKRVIVRCDFNVPVENGIITDNAKIINSLKTIKFLRDNNCKVILLSHFGRVKKEEDKKTASLDLVAQELANSIGEPVAFIGDCMGVSVANAVNDKEGIILLENTRFTDVPNKKESANDLELAKFWAGLADIYINDAFGTLHRVHSSTAGISKFLPTALGFLVEEELTKLDCLVKDTKKPFVVFMGGAKVDDKLPIIKSLINRCDYILLGGGIANSFLKAKGEDIGNSLATNDPQILEELKELIKQYPEKIILPTDFIIDNDAIMDLGLNTIEEYSNYINKASVIFVNGTCGKFEDKRFAMGTKALFECLKKSGKKVIVGGGDTASAARTFGYENGFYHISTGGGATLEYIADGKLAALEWMKENEIRNMQLEKQIRQREK